MESRTVSEIIKPRKRLREIRTEIADLKEKLKALKAEREIVSAAVKAETAEKATPEQQ
jgi:predicted component of type VI protein secretion system